MAVVFVTVLIDLVGFGIVLPLLPFFATELGATAFEVGLIIGSYSAMQFLFSPVWGRLSDRVGRRLPLVLGLVGSSLSYVIFALAGTIGVLLFSRVVAGVMGATVPVAQAYIADSTSLERRARGMGLIGVAFGLGFIIGPAIGGGLSRWGYAVPGYAAAAASLLSAVAAVIFLPRDRVAPGPAAGPAGSRLAAERAAAELAASIPPETAGGRGARLGQAARVLGRAALRGPILAFFLGTVGFAAYTTTLPLFLDSALGLTAAHAGGFFALAGLCSVISQGGLVGPLVERGGEASVGAAGAALLAGGLVAFGWLEGVAAAIVLVAVIGAGWGLMAPSLQSLVSRRAHPTEQGEVLGVNQSLSSLGRVIGPLAGGWAFGSLGHGWAFTAAGLLVAATAASAWSMRRAGNGRPPTP